MIAILVPLLFSILEFGAALERWLAQDAATVQAAVEDLSRRYPGLRERRGWPQWGEALRRAHAPEAEADLSPTTPARERLAYDEIFASQLAVALVRARRHRQKGRAILGTGALTGRVEAALGFALTSAQRLAIAELTAEMAQPRRMVRLLQGDVGSGKTVVALLAMLNAVEGGGQAALMAPTEILARQHHATLQRHAAAARHRGHGHGRCRG